MKIGIIGAGNIGGNLTRRLSALGLRSEDKGPIQVVHWRGAADDPAAELAAREIATGALPS